MSATSINFPERPFSELERRVIWLGFALNEPAYILTGRRVSRLERIRRLIFGFRPSKPLADKRLEALRALAAAIRNCPSAPDAAVVEASVTAGWSQRHISMIQEIAYGVEHRDTICDAPLLCTALAA
ncbi:hypothetical protein C1T17_05940 [Sphingobium sp. SCG-1]|nr:hypothetical protein C1T17_05940 [Sphingobium sp. SCG-1]